LTQLGQEQFQTGTGGLNALFNMGANEQKLGQAALDYPMIQAQNYAKLLQGQTIPGGSIKQAIGPGQQGQFGISPLAQIGSLGSILYSLYKGDPNSVQNAATTAVQAGQPVKKAATGGAVMMAEGGGLQDVMPKNAAYHDGQGNYYDQDGYLVG
jgi:hypothetical protein